MSKQTFRLGTRGSLLALTQSRQIADALEKLHPNLQIELIIIKTTGDIITDKPLHEAGGKGLFTKELELALINNDVDFAVHSYKDVPVTMPLVDVTSLSIAATPTREDFRDVLAFGTFGLDKIHVTTLESGESGHAIELPKNLMDIPAGSRIGTGSLRRACQIRHHRPDLLIVPIRGNIDTRLRKLRDGDFDVVVLAMAGLHRTRLFDATQMRVIESDVMVPASCQGALALQCRTDDRLTMEILKTIHDPDTELCVNAEREIVRGLNGDCKSPIGVLAELAGDIFHLRTFVGPAEGATGAALSHAQSGKKGDAADITRQMLHWLNHQNVQPLLHPNR